MIIAARTGQGKTLCFGIPILDLCIRKIEKFHEKSPDVKYVFPGAVGLILSPTRELAI